MTSDDKNTALYEKMRAEQDGFRDWLKSQPPDVILNKSYEYAVREDIVMAMEEKELTDAQADALLALEKPLSAVYEEFYGIETCYMEIVTDSISSCANKELKAAQEQRDALRNLPVYLYPALYARDSGELEQYRASRKANLACKEAIDNAISENYSYEESCLNSAAAVRQVVDAFGYDRTLYVLAVTVQHKARDGRISDSNKEWAASVPVMEDRNDGSADQNVFLMAQSHPGLLDLFISATRKAQAAEKATEQQKEVKTTARTEEKPSILERLKKPVQKNAPNHSAKLSVQEL